MGRGEYLVLPSVTSATPYWSPKVSSKGRYCSSSRPSRRTLSWRACRTNCFSLRDGSASLGILAFYANVYFRNQFEVIKVVNWGCCVASRGAAFCQPSPPIFWWILPGSAKPGGQGAFLGCNLPARHHHQLSRLSIFDQSILQLSPLLVHQSSHHPHHILQPVAKMTTAHRPTFDPVRFLSHSHQAPC